MSYVNSIESINQSPGSLMKLLGQLGVHRYSADRFAEAIPFTRFDTTVGVENELQTVVIGNSDQVDLPILIKESNFYQNNLKRSQRGETPKKKLADLERFINDTDRQVWENSWLRFPRAVLSQYADHLFNTDLLTDKSDPNSPKRSDACQFSFYQQGEEWLRVPASYLFKLALADFISSDSTILASVRRTGEKVMGHFLNDNTSPETFSFHPVSMANEPKMGKGTAKESLRRFLLTHLLTAYANIKFRLLKNGQQGMVYFAPHPPVRQKQLNDIISDSFYRQIFMSPCLSGWDKGEEKCKYMSLCHQVLSRSQMNAVVKMKNAGIITSNLIVLPNISNISLSNNGTHISLGSRKLTSLLADPQSGFSTVDEKYWGDLVIKIVEHFLPLFVGTYSASPYRLDFWDFHPEKVLGFLPHQLDYTHLRMIWRRWRKKARLKILGQPITPFGPLWLDKTISKIFRLKGDFVPDYRLIDYLVALMSTDQSPALDGTLNNDIRLKNDLSDMGIFDPNMTLYMLFRAREYEKMGFSGFEARQYSLFKGFMDDMGEATNLQILINALAFKYIMTGGVLHQHIPDNPSVESERRQLFFGSAIGLPTFFIRKNTQNIFMSKILKRMQRTRLSRRYPGYIRGHHHEYKRALLNMIKEDAADLIEMMDLKDTIKDLEQRIEYPQEYSVAGKLTQGILDEASAKSPNRIRGEEFNLAAESYYRNTLRIQHIDEAYELLISEVKQMASHLDNNERVDELLQDQDLITLLQNLKYDVLTEEISLKHIQLLIQLSLMVVESQMHQHDLSHLDN